MTTSAGKPDTALPHQQHGLSRVTVLLLAAVCGAAVANIYYAQPLLPAIAGAFGVSEGSAGLLVTASQVGYATALALLVPLGDVLERRRLAYKVAIKVFSNMISLILTKLLSNLYIVVPIFPSIRVHVSAFE